MRLWGLILVSAVLIGASGSVAYACGNGGHGGGSCDGGRDQGKGDCGTAPNIVWENPSGDQPSAAPVGCSLLLTTSTLYVAAGNLAPGENCTFHAILANIGTQTATLSQVITINQPPNCRLFAFSDNLPAKPPKALTPKGTFAFHGTISLSSKATNRCQGAKASFLVTITGQGSSDCDSVPVASGPVAAVIPDWDC